MKVVVHLKRGLGTACSATRPRRCILTSTKARVTCHECLRAVERVRSLNLPPETRRTILMSAEDRVELERVPRQVPEPDRELRERYREWLTGVLGMLDGAEVIGAQVIGHKEVRIRFRTRGRMVVTLRADRVEEVGS